MLDFLYNFDESQIEEKYKDFKNQLLYKHMTGVGIIHVLNKLVSFIDSDKCYLEVGTHRGSTLAGAAFENIAPCFGVDNFCGHNSLIEIEPFSSVEEGLQHTIKQFNVLNANYFKQSYQEFFKNRNDVNGMKVEVYLYDGDHQYENQKHGVLVAEPVMADEAIVLVDDSGTGDAYNVHRAVDEILQENANFTFVKEFMPRTPNDYDGMWNGLLILKYSRKNA